MEHFRWQYFDIYSAFQGLQCAALIFADSQRSRDNIYILLVLASGMELLEWINLKIAVRKRCENYWVCAKNQTKYLKKIKMLKLFSKRRKNWSEKDAKIFSYHEQFLSVSRVDLPCQRISHILYIHTENPPRPCAALPHDVSSHQDF